MPNRDSELLAQLERAYQLHAARHWEEALRRYQEIIWRCRIDWNPEIAARGLHLSGVIFLQLGRWNEAIDLIQQAIQADPQPADYYGNLGFAYLQRNEIDAAEKALVFALRLRPDYPEAMNNLGNVYLRQNAWQRAIHVFENLLKLHPESAEGHNSYGVALQRSRAWTQSLIQFEQAIALRPGYAEAYYNAGLSLLRLHRLDEAKEKTRMALTNQPDFAEAHRTLGNIAACHGDHQQAIVEFKNALQREPDLVEALVDLGNSLGEQRNYDSACEAYHRALRFKPDCKEAYFNLGYTLERMGQSQAAIEALEQAHRLSPGYSDALLVPLWQSLCNWESAELGAQRLLDALDRTADDQVSPAAPFTILTLPIPSSPKQQWEAARRYVQTLEIAETTTNPWLIRPRRRPSEGSRLRIGYLSGDFREHAVGYLSAELIETHDRSRFEVFGYSIGPDDGSPQRKRFERAFDHFHDLNSLAHPVAAELICQDQIDILIDLQGHTRQARTQILALRPAPIQVNFLGYPGTMGASFIDYIVVDPFVVPSEQSPFYSERLLTIPGCYQVNDSQAVLGLPRLERKDFGLANDAIVICSFNSPYKITRPIFDIWMQFLQADARCVLWLLESLPEVTRRLQQEAESKGVSQTRLIFAPVLPRREYLARLALADLFVDSFPVNAHTTASDCLRMGVPILTLSGETFVSRVAGSLLTTLGLEELIADSLEAYAAKGLYWIEHPEELSSLRTRLHAKLQETNQFDGRVFARKFEKLLDEMWHRYDREVAAPQTH